MPTSQQDGALCIQQSTGARTFSAGSLRGCAAAGAAAGALGWATRGGPCMRGCAAAVVGSTRNSSAVSPSRSSRSRSLYQFSPCGALVPAASRDGTNFAGVGPLAVTA